MQGSEKIVYKTVRFHTVHYENMPTQYTAIFHGCKKVNFQMKKMMYIFFNFCSKHRLWIHVRIEAVLTSTHKLCFREKIRKEMYTPVFYLYM